MRTALLLVAAAGLAVLTACPPKPAEEALPPSGLAGAPAAAGLQPTTALPGSGMQVADPAGVADPSTSLPPGHPPIDGVAQAPAPPLPVGGSEALPAGHPPVGGAAAPAAAAAAGGAGDNVALTGSVLETLDVPTYTYMRVKTGAGEEWIAVNTAPIKVGDTVTVTQALVMEQFHSKSLNRTFPRLIMGMLVGAPKGAAKAASP